MEWLAIPCGELKETEDRMTEAFEPLRIGSTVRLAMCEPDKQRGKLVDMASHHQDGDVDGVTFDHAAIIVYWNEELEVIHDCV
jgi:hypothetical protein